MSDQPTNVLSMQGKRLDPATAGLPPPPLPADCSFRQFDWMPFFGVRWLNSARRFKAPEGGLDAMLALQVEAWRQVPAASLPADDKELAHLAGLARLPKIWQRVRKWVLEEWVLHSDGRLYHLDMVERALDAWKAGERTRNASKAYRDRRKNIKPETAKKLRRGGSVAKTKPVIMTSSSRHADVPMTSSLEKEKEKEKENPNSEGQSPSVTVPVTELQEPAVAAFEPPAETPPAPPADPVAPAAPPAPGARRPPAAARTPRQPEDMPDGDLVDAMPGKAGAGVFWDESVARWQRIVVRSGQQCPTPDNARAFIGQLMSRSGSDITKVASALLAAELVNRPPASPKSYVLGILGGDKRKSTGIASRSLGDDHKDEAMRLAAQADADRAARAARRNPQSTMGPARGPILEGECS